MKRDWIVNAVESSSLTCAWSGFDQTFLFLSFLLPFEMNLMFSLLFVSHPCSDHELLLPCLQHTVLCGCATLQS